MIAIMDRMWGIMGIMSIGMMITIKEDTTMPEWTGPGVDLPAGEGGVTLPTLQ
jgi:hypothetical protein